MLEFLITLGGISLAMSAVIVFMLMLQKPIKKRFAAISRYIIWAVIIIRLCIPVSLDIMPKLVTLPADIPETEIITSKPMISDTVIPEEVVTPSLPSEETENEPSINNTVDEKYTPSTPTAEPVAANPAFEITGEHIVTLMFAVWAIGAVSFAVFTLVRYRINAKRLDRSLTLPDAEVWSIYDTVCRDLNIKKAPPLYMGRADVSPMVYGFIRPKVILPSVEMSLQSVAYILRHELTHYKRGDLWFKLIAMLANALHWFNPLAYIACGMMSSEAELSCDESALRKTDLIGRLGYGNSMLEIVKLCRHSPKLTTGFSPKKRAVKERFENMINTTKKKKGYWMVALIVVCALLCTSIIGCTTKDSEPKDTDETLEIVEDQRYGTGAYDIDGEWLKGWCLYEEDGILSLEHSDEEDNVDVCYRYGDSTLHNDVIDMTPTFKRPESSYRYPTLDLWVSDNYGLISYCKLSDNVADCPNQYIFMVDLATGEVVHKLYYDVDYILELHGLDRNVLSAYESWNGNPPEYDVTVDISRYEMAGEPPTNKMMISHKLENKDIRRAHVYTYFDMETGELSQPEKGFCNLQELVKNGVVTDIDDIVNMDGIEESNVEVLKAFLSKDTTTLERLGGYEPGTLKAYTTLEFGDYRIKSASLLSVDILESGIEGLEAGIHEFEYSTAYRGKIMLHKCKHNEVTSNEAYKAVDRWLDYCVDDVMLPVGDEYTDSDYYKVLSYIINTTGVSDPEEIEDAAKRIFDVDLSVDIYSSDMSEDAKNEALYGFLKSVYEYKEANQRTYIYDIIEASDKSATVLFYADRARTIPACKVKYTFKNKAGQLVFKKSKYIERTNLGIASYRDDSSHEQEIYAEIG